jgi:uncharacterized protein DUF6625
MSGILNPWLIMLCPYFGRWPAWINFFVESCKWNPDVRWRFYTDCGEPENRASNIDYVPIGFDDYEALARARLGITYDPVDPYKLCDLRPALGFLHDQDTVGYPFFGYGDLDVIYGNISSFYGEERLADLDVVSTHPERLSGHFAGRYTCRHLPWHIHSQPPADEAAYYRETSKFSHYTGGLNN